MAKHLKKAVCVILAFVMLLTVGSFADFKTYGYSDTESFYDRLSVKLTDAVYDYLDEVYIEKYPEMGLRFKYGTEKDRQELQTLADTITEGKTNDMEKARAICRWVKASLTYGSGSAYPIDTFRNRKGVCLNYSLLASTLMRLAGIPSVVVDGHRGGLKTVSFSDLKYSGHAWLYAHINGEWVMFDPLWTAGTPFTKEDKEYLASYYLINTIEGIYITFDGMDLYDVNLFSSGARGDGPIYYQGKFRYVSSGFVDGEHYDPGDLTNASLSINGINLSVSICHRDGTVSPDGTSVMSIGDIYYNGWWGDCYYYENGVVKTSSVQKAGDLTYYFSNGGSVWLLGADEDKCWLENGCITFKTGSEGYLIKDKEDVPDNTDCIYKYSLYTDYGDDCITLTEDGYMEAKKEGYYEIYLKIYDADDGGLFGSSIESFYVKDARPEVDYSSGTIDISNYYPEISSDYFMYTGEEIRPTVTITESSIWVGGQTPTLTEGEDYTVSYENNILPGYGRVIVTGKGLFSGTTSATFFIDHEHIWEEASDGEIPWNACENEWNKEFTCKLCGETKYETCAPLGHNWGEWEIASDPGCTWDGDMMRTCSVCGKTEYESIPATGHTLYIEESLSKAPTCTEQGKNVYFCKDCKYAREETIAALGHDWGSDGKCTRCGEAQGIDGWVQDDDGIWHYYTKGIAATGLTPVDGASYYFDESGNMLTGWISIMEPISDYYPDRLVEKWLYAESSGALATGWRAISGKWYYFGDDHRMYYDGDYEINDKKYYFAYSGQMLTGWIKETVYLYLEEHIPDTRWYYANSSGELQKGWKKIGGVWYYFSPYSCVMMDGGVCEIDGKEYFFYPSGAMGTGWCKVDPDSWYYANSLGVLQKGWLKIGGVWYYFDKDSRNRMLSYCCVLIEGKYYAFAESGAWISGTGWQKLGDTKYQYAFYPPTWHYIQNGEVLTGWQKLGGVWYYLTPAMVNRNSVINKKLELFNSSGAWKSTYKTPGWVQNSNDWYYVEDSDGALAVGWRTINGATYYFDPDDCYMYHYDDADWSTRYYYIGDDMYYFDENGALQTGIFESATGFGFKYYADDKGRIQTGWQEINGFIYYFDPYMICDEYYEIDGVMYYFDEEGHLKTD